jgi:hypothetical protein
MMLSLERFVVKMTTKGAPKGPALRASPKPVAEGASASISAAGPAVDHRLWDSVLQRCLRPPGDTVQGIAGTSLFDYKLLFSDAEVAADFLA